MPTAKTSVSDPLRIVMVTPDGTQGRIGITLCPGKTDNTARFGPWARDLDLEDQDGDLIDILVQPRRDARAVRRFFRRLLNSQRQEPVRLVTDKLGSYRVAHLDVMPLVTHDTTRYANNRAEVSHQPTRQRERQMRGFTSSAHAQCFLHVHGIIQNLFRVGRHRLRSVHHRMLRARAFTVWTAVTAA